MRTPLSIAVFSILGLAAFAVPSATPALPTSDALPIQVSADATSAMGVRLLAGANGEHYVSWVERHGKESRLLFSQLDDELQWGAPKLISQGSDWFVNWADFPVLCALTDGTLAATWLQSAGREGAWDYGARISFSKDSGDTWTESVVLHEDSTGPEYGFVSLVALGPKTFGAVWLDSRNMKASDHDDGGHGEGSMALYFRRFGADGSAGPELMLDDRTCECCSTSAVVAESGAMQVAYRNRDADEVRDMHLVTLGGAVGFDRRETITDGWTFPACPVNGPSLTSHGEQLAMAWFTGAGGKPAVKVAISKDGGANFGFPTQVDQGSPIGRALSCFDEDGELFVAWLEAPRAESGESAKWLLRDVGKDDEPVVLAEVQAARTSGFASLTKAPGGGLLFAWTTTPKGEGSQTGVVSSRIQ